MSEERKLNPKEQLIVRKAEYGLIISIGVRDIIKDMMVDGRDMGQMEFESEFLHRLKSYLNDSEQKQTDLKKIFRDK